MNFKLFLNRTANIQAGNRLLKAVVVVLGVALVINTICTVYALKYQRTIIVPPGLKEQVVIEGSKVDNAYVLQFARYLIALTFNYTPATVRRQYEEALLYFDAGSYPKAKTLFYELADKVVETKVSSVFHPLRFEINTTTNKIEVLGNRLQMVDDRTVESGTKTYIIEYRILDGKFTVLNIGEKV